MPKNLLFVTQYSDLGGGETALLSLVDHLNPAEYLPHLLVPREGQLAAAWRKRAWPVHLQAWRGATTYFIPQLWAHFPPARFITDLIRHQQISLVDSDYHTLPMALPAAERAGVACVWRCWGWWFKPKAWQRRFFQRPAALFAHSETIRRGFLGDPPFIAPERMAVLYSGVDTARFNPNADAQALRAELGLAADTPLVAMLARFQSVKGHEVFQAMVRRVAETHPSAQFIVAGENTHTRADETYKAGILSNAQTDPLLRGRLHYIGFRADTERVLAAADVVVSSSHFESYGMAIVEAMACGKPVVSTANGGPSETIIPGLTGELVPPADAVALAAAVSRLLADANLRARMGAAGRARVLEHFAAQACADRYSAGLEKLLKAKQTP